MSTQIFRSKTGVAIRTEAQTEDAFVKEISALFGNICSEVILDEFRKTAINQKGEIATDDPYKTGYDYDEVEVVIESLVKKHTALDLIKLLPKVINIACKFRGYKSDVQETRVIICGDRLENQDYSVSEVDNRNQYMLSQKVVIRHDETEVATQNRTTASVGSEK